MGTMEFHAVSQHLPLTRHLSEAVRYVMNLFHADAGQRQLRRHRHIRCHIHYRSRIKAHGDTSLSKLDSRLSARLMNGIGQFFQPRDIHISAMERNCLGELNGSTLATSHIFSPVSALHPGDAIPDQLIVTVL